MYTRLPVWAPSPVADPLFREVPEGRRRSAEIARDHRRLRATSPSTAPRAASTASSCSARTRSIVRGFLSPATNRRTDGYGGLARATGPGCCSSSSPRCARRSARPRARRAPLRRRADRGRHDDRRGGRRRRAGRGHRSRRLHQHLDRRRHRDALHDRGVDARAARLRLVHPRRAIREAVELPVVGVGRFKDPLQAERGARRGPLRPGRRRARPDRRRRLRSPSRARATSTTCACACRATRSASAAWA